MRIALFSALVILSGCITPDTLTEPEPTGTPTDALLLADPSTVTDADLHARALELQENYWKFSQVQGVCWQPSRSDNSLADPDGYGKGGDTALFTGYALATFSFEAAHLRTPEAMDRAYASLRGLYYVTHAAGRGVIARCAFPTADAAKWRYPQKWHSTIASHPDFVGESTEPVPGPALPAPHNRPIPPSTYYTRATRDQLTGITFGLSVAWSVLPESHDVVAEITQDLYDRLSGDDWKIRDGKGENATSADSVDGLLKTAFLRLYATTNGCEEAIEEYEDEFSVVDLGAKFNAFANAGSYYAHNLRAARSFGAWMLEMHPWRQKYLADYYLKHVWEHVIGHQNAWFSYITTIIGSSRSEAYAEAHVEGRASLASLSLRPDQLWASPYGGQSYRGPGYLGALLGVSADFVLPPHLRKPTDYFLWQKDPWAVGSGASDASRPPEGNTTGLSFLLPYWMARYFGRL